VKKVIIFLQLVCVVHILYAQSDNVGTFDNIDSLHNVLSTSADNDTRAMILFRLTAYYIDNNLDSSLQYIKQFNEIPSKSKQSEAAGLGLMGDISLRLGNASIALETLLKGSKIAEELNDSAGIAMAYWNIGKVYQSLDENNEAISYYLRSVKIAAAAQDSFPQSLSMGSLGRLYMNLDRLDSALYYTRSAYEIRNKYPRVIIRLFSWLNLETYTEDQGTPTLP